jgi:glutamate/aspartate transport system substrate-binding protein
MHTKAASLLGRSVLAAAALLAGAAALAQTRPPIDTLARVAASKTITLGVRQDAAPFSYIDAAGKPAGFTWALCQAVVQRLAAELKTPVTVKFETLTLAQSFNWLREGRIDLHCGSTAHTAERAQSVVFSDTFYVSRVVAAYRAQDGKYASAREFGRAGVLQGSTAQQLMQNYASRKAERVAIGAVVPLATYAEGVRMLKAGQIDTLVADELLIPKDAAIATRREQLTLEPYALVMRKDDRAFADAVDRALRKIVTGPQGRQLADAAGLKIDPMTSDAWRNPNKLPAPPLF